MDIKPKFFKRPDLFRKWLEKNHEKKTELWVGFYKKATGKTSITWSESVDQAICFGWIDGIRKRYNDESYMIRFTPRKPTSVWSDVNIKKANELTKAGLMFPMGIAAFKKRKKERSGVYSFEQKKGDIKFSKDLEDIFKKNKTAWKFFQSMAPYYKRAATWWVISAKKEETRLRRLNVLINDSENQLKIKELRR